MLSAMWSELAQVHFRSFPSDILLRWDGDVTLRAAFLNSLKVRSESDADADSESHAIVQLIMSVRITYGAQHSTCQSPPTYYNCVVSRRLHIFARAARAVSWTWPCRLRTICGALSQL